MSGKSLCLVGEKKSMLELITVNSQEFGKAAVVMDLFALSSSSLFPII